MGIGIIAVSWRAMDEILGVPPKTEYRLDDVPLDSIQTALKLPDGYTVYGTGTDYLRGVYLVAVAGVDIPDVPLGQMAPEVVPTYSRDADGTVRVLDIKVYTPPDRLPWHPVPVPNQ